MITVIDDDRGDYLIILTESILDYEIQIVNDAMICLYDLLDQFLIMGKIFYSWLFAYLKRDLVCDLAKLDR